MGEKVKVSVRHLTKKFGDLLVLNDCSFDVLDGDLLCVVGPTGCGKTTFLNSLVNIYDITAGEILLEILYFLCPWLVPMIWIAVSLFIGLVQAYIFTTLTSVYMKESVD